MDIEKFRELCAAYFIGDLDEGEFRILKQALESGDKNLIKIFTDFQKIYFRFPLTVEKRIPGKLVKNNLLRNIKKNIEPETGFVDKLIDFLKNKNPRFAFSLMIVLLITIAGLSYLVLEQNKTITEQQNRITELTNQAEQNEAILKVIGAKQFEVVILNGLSVNPNGYGKILWNPVDKKAVLQLSNLPTTKPGKDYQFWVIRNNKPESNGIFSIEHESEKFFEVTNLVEADRKSINAFAITLEPKGGVPQPTGAMYLMGSPSTKF